MADCRRDRCCLRACRVKVRPSLRLSRRLAGLLVLGVCLAAPLAASEADEVDEPRYHLLPRPLFVQAPVPPQPLPPQEPERPKPRKPQEQLLLERGAILLRRGTLQVEPSVDYTHFSSDRVAISGLTVFEAIIIGLIRVDLAFPLNKRPDDSSYQIWFGLGHVF